LDSNIIIYRPVQEPCLIFLTCDNCVNGDGSCDAFKSTYSSNATSVQNLTRYATSLEYNCGLGKEFVHPTITGQTIASHTISCTWERAWFPTGAMLNCTCKILR
jgi:hypothetical protein